MIATRTIPCLLLQNGGLVKTIKFRDPKYLGDPINTVRLFNDKEVDELVFLDINATLEKKAPPIDLLAQITSECFMPLCYGGGVRDMETMRMLYGMGIEKLSLNSITLENPALVTEASREFGAQSVIVSIDVKITFTGRYKVVTHGGRKTSSLDPVAHAQAMEEAGAGEILLNSVDRDGTMTGYDLALVRAVASAVSIPVVACGGAANVADLGRVVKEAGAAAAAAGSMFVFQGSHRAVLISYPSQKELHAAFA